MSTGKPAAVVTTVRVPSEITTHEKLQVAQCTHQMVISRHVIWSTPEMPAGSLQPGIQSTRPWSGRNMHRLVRTPRRATTAAFPAFAGLSVDPWGPLCGA